MSEREVDNPGQGGKVRVGPEFPAPHRPLAAHVLQIVEEETIQALPISWSRFSLTCRAQRKGEARAGALDFV
jgi:hypothetical protein